MHGTPGPTRFSVRNVDSPLAAFQLFMRSRLVKEILKWTNKEGSLVYKEAWQDTTNEEFLRYLGVLVLSGVYKSRNESIRQLWSKEDGRPIFDKSMARNRFEQITRVLRFDDAVRRRENRQADKLAAIRTVSDMWQTTLQDVFVPYENVTVDE